MSPILTRLVDTDARELSMQQGNDAVRSRLRGA